MLMRNDLGSSNSLVAMLTSCNPHVGFQGGWIGFDFRNWVFFCVVLWVEWF